MSILMGMAYEKTDMRIEHASGEAERTIIYPSFLQIHIKELRLVTFPLVQLLRSFRFSSVLPVCQSSQLSILVSSFSAHLSFLM